MFSAFAVCVFCFSLCVAFFVHLPFVFVSVFAAVSEFSVAFVLHCWAEAAGARHKGEQKVRPNPEDDQNEKHKPGCGGRPKCKKNASLQTEAGQNAKKSAKKNTNKTCKTMQKTTQKMRKNMQLLEKAANFQIVNDSGNDRKLLHFFACFVAFWPASVCRLAFFLHFGRPPHPGLCFSFWSSSGFGRTFFSPLCRAPAASAQHYAKQMQRQILRHGGKHQKKRTANAKNCKTKTQATNEKANAKYMQTKIPNADSVCGPKILIKLRSVLPKPISPSSPTTWS